MMKVGVNLKDQDFARALVKGLAAEGRNIFFSLCDLNDEAEDGDFDLVVTDRVMNAPHHIQLVKCSEAAECLDGPPYRIFAYEDARNFVSKLLHIYFLETGRNLEFSGDSRCKILVFSSLSACLDATALALATGEMLDRYFGCRCLYLNLCPIDGSKCFLPESSSKGLLTLLYYLSQDRDFPLTSFIKKSLHVDAIDTKTLNPYFDELDVALVRRLLKKIDDMGSYDYLLLDVGNHFSRGNKSFLSLAEEVILVTDRQDQIPAPFFHSVLRLLEEAGAGCYIRRILLEKDQSEGEMLDDHSLLDLSAMKYIQWEAGRLAKNLMERNHDD